MNKFKTNLLAFLLYFYSKKKRKAFRAKHYRNAEYDRELRKRGILGRDSFVGFGTIITDKRTRIGKFCSIASNVMIGTTTHPTQFLSSSSVFYKDISNVTEGLALPRSKWVKYTFSEPVTIGNDVWIGRSAIVMDGLTIGDGAIVGAGAVVTHDVPPYAIAVGVPARVIKYRFDEETIKRLLKVRWWDQPDEVIASLKADDVEGCLKLLESLPEPPVK
ncbi:CatB-related O-acetyltransferase [bacterium]|nr:CatB-related O-acetyltransferase [bacterium]